MYGEDDYLPISALQHLVFCERQWGLIHLDRLWEENIFTAEGRAMHDRAHSDATEVRGDTRTARGLALKCSRLGIWGKADIVEFHRINKDAPAASAPVPLPGEASAEISQYWRVIPVEYKRGKPKSIDCDEVQVCAQALCLEEMLNVHIEYGYLFYGKPKRRTQVTFDEKLRGRTERLARRLHDLTAIGKTPQEKYAKKCDTCSLLDQCMPRVTGTAGKAGKYMAKAIAGISAETGEEE